MILDMLSLVVEARILEKKILDSFHAFVHATYVTGLSLLIINFLITNWHLIQTGQWDSTVRVSTCFVHDWPRFDPGTPSGPQSLTGVTLTAEPEISSEKHQLWLKYTPPQKKQK